MTFTHKELAEVDLGRLGHAVSDWKSTVDHLKSLARDAKDGMQAKSESARWAGANATVTREFVRKTAKEINDLYTEAQSIHQVLDDAHRELVTVQRQLRSLMDQADKQNFHITDNGDTTVTVGERLAPGEPTRGTPEKTLKSLANQISAKLGHANDIDKSVKFALARIHGKDSHNAGHADYKDLNEAQAARAHELAKKGTRMTDSELKELNRILKYNATEKGGEFASDFYKSFGSPKAALEFYGSMSIDGTTGEKKTRLHLTQDLQRGMGLALASATDVDHNKHPLLWGDQFRKLGVQRINIPGAGPENNMPRGYQILGGLLRYGNYNAKFLNPIAGHIVQLHHEAPDLFARNKPVASMQFDSNLGFNPSGKGGTGYDPLASALEALGHSPEASKEFFSDNHPDEYDTVDGSVKSKNGLGYDYLKELTGKKFQWISDGVTDDGKNHGIDALGHALESATLGHAYDDPNPKLVRDVDSSSIMERVVDQYSSDPKFVQQQKALTDSLGRMGAGYIDDLQWGLDGGGPRGHDKDASIFAPLDNDLVDHALFDKDTAGNFLSMIGKYPDAYADVSAANRIYTTSVMEAQVDGAHVVHPGALEVAVRHGADIQGQLDHARAEQYRVDGLAKDKEYNDALQKRNGWIEFGAGAALAGGVALLPEAAAVGVVATAIPVMSDAGEGALEHVIGNTMGDWTESSQQDSTNKIQDHVASIYASGDANTDSPLRSFMYHHQIDRNGELGARLDDARWTGYDHGTNYEAQQGKAPQKPPED